MYQTFSKAIMHKEILWNLSCVGCDSLHFLENFIPLGGLSTVYVNHPEPPTQIITTRSISDNISDTLYSTTPNNEPSHMLSSKTMHAISKCLLKDEQGKLIIVTDNLSYAKLLCVTILKVNQMERNIVLESMTDLHNAPLEPFEIFNHDKSYLVQQHNQYANKKAKFGKNSKIKDIQRKDSVILYKGYPCEAVGHYSSNNSSGNSYFDRLWRTGVGSKYAEVDKRYIIALKTRRSSS